MRGRGWARLAIYGGTLLTFVAYAVTDKSTHNAICAIHATWVGGVCFGAWCGVKL